MYHTSQRTFDRLPDLHVIHTVIQADKDLWTDGSSCSAINLGGRVVGSVWQGQHLYLFDHHLKADQYLVNRCSYALLLEETKLTLPETSIEPFRKENMSRDTAGLCVRSIKFVNSMTLPIKLSHKTYDYLTITIRSDLFN